MTASSRLPLAPVRPAPVSRRNDGCDLADCQELAVIRTARRSVCVAHAHEVGAYVPAVPPSPLGAETIVGVTVSDAQADALALLGYCVVRLEGIQQVVDEWLEGRASRGMSMIFSEALASISGNLRDVAMVLGVGHQGGQ